MPTHSPLTPRLAARIVTRVARGIPIETVASQLGLSGQTLFNWQHEGSTESGRFLTSRLRESIRRARAHREWHVLHSIDGIAFGPEEKSADRLKALTWTLERHPAYRDRYGLKVELEHKGTVDHTLRKLEQQPTNNVLEQAPQSFQMLLEPEPLEPE